MTQLERPVLLRSYFLRLSDFGGSGSHDLILNPHTLSLELRPLFQPGPHAIDVIDCINALPGFTPTADQCQQGIVPVLTELLYVVVTGSAGPEMLCDPYRRQQRVVLQRLGQLGRAILRRSRFLRWRGFGSSGSHDRILLSPKIEILPVSGVTSRELLVSRVRRQRTPPNPGHPCFRATED